jgi:KDO2-lipid IV(A) lauroyltransferase
MKTVLYKLFYSFFYLLSLLPWRVLYFISDGIAFILRRVIQYRVAVVDHNLAIAFPHKTIAERTKIKNEFYQQFTDTFIETIKMLSMSDNFSKKIYLQCRSLK